MATIQLPSELKRYLLKFIEQINEKRERLDRRKKRAILNFVIDNIKMEKNDLIKILKKYGGEDSIIKKEATGDKAEYQKKRSAIAAKFDVKHGGEIKDIKKKKAYYNALDKAHVADHEE